MHEIKRVGAVCDWGPSFNSIVITEYVELVGGRRIVWRSSRAWMRSGKCDGIGPTYSLARACVHAIAESGEFEYFHAIVTGLARLNIRVTLASLYMAPFVIDMSSRLRGVIVLAAQESAKVQQIANKSDEVTPAYEIAEIGIVAELFPSPDDLQILEYVTLVAPHTSVVWKSDRGWKLSARRAEPGVIIGPVCELAREGINLTEEDDEPTLLYLECISRVFEQAGVHVDPASLYRAPYRFSIGGRMQRVLSDEVDDMLTQYEIAKLWCKDGFDFTEQLLDTEYLHLR